MILWYRILVKVLKTDYKGKYLLAIFNIKQCKKEQYF